MYQNSIDAKAYVKPKIINKHKLSDKSIRILEDCRIMKYKRHTAQYKELNTQKEQ